jgi:hypothetical protein
MGSAGELMSVSPSSSSNHGITLEYTQDRQFIYAKINPVPLRRALEQEPAFEVLLFAALETIGYSSFAYQLDMQQLEDLSHMPWHTLRQTLVRRIATRTEFTLDMLISPDKMEAKARLQRAFADEKVSEEGLIQRLAEYGVVAGIDRAAFSHWVQGNAIDEDEYCVVAVGQLPVAGQDERLVPLQHKLWVSQNTPLARHEKATAGVAGYTVDGVELSAKRGNSHAPVLDKYCRLKDDIVYADIEGVMMFTPFLISLSPLYTVSVEQLFTPEAEDSLSLAALAEEHESLAIVGTLCDTSLEVDGHLWIQGDCERVQLKVGGHLFVQGDLRGASIIQAGGALWAQSIRESSLLVAQGVFTHNLHTTQVFSGQKPAHLPPMIQSVWHPADHPFFENEKWHLQISLQRLLLQTKTCVQQLIEARKQENTLHIKKLLRLSQRLQRRRFFFEAALAGYRRPFDKAYAFDPVRD